MHVTVAGEKVKAAVSNDGLFHDLEGKHSATTLKGLERIMNAAPKAVGPPILVEHAHTLKQGRVISKSTDRYSHSYRVKWDDGKFSVVSIYNLRKQMTPAERTQLAQLENAAEDAHIVSQAADDVYTQFSEQFNVDNDLQERFRG